MGKTAIILGATGLTGSILLKKLMNDQRYETIKLFSRKKIEGLPKKVTQYIGDVLTLQNFKEEFKADEVFCCIGTTAKKTPNKETYKKIDFGIPATAAKLSKENNINTFLVISALGANEKSAVFYNKTKGQMQQEVLKQNIANTFILQPSIIDGNRNETRIGEKIGLIIFKLIQPLFIGPLKKYKVIKAEEIAQAMLNLANTKTINKNFITSNYIKEISKK
ncbi:NAD(P)H-binding protein [Lutibacter maritimus]|uniref:NAD dependent epimerase/dehydratase family protein n=1 Tax=Lutibacter maritimus TaxID=593133 RepID=A0A1I6PG36_9FLAO|nr:NAD(P)H-binding protein [Lutibacter maritimus]SFS39164.1 NAD dependent epimerase/dehydratase family protein [Lutibacter maritimus]